MKPLIAIVGRPNVGKSTLLNRMAGREVAMVADIPGVTRDRIFVETRIDGRAVILVDTGGFDPDPEDDLTRALVDQTEMAIEEADAVLLICDARDGLHPVDQTIATRLRKSGKPTLCVVNKSDPGAISRNEGDFYKLGMEPLPISALHGSGLGELGERLALLLPPTSLTEDEGPVDLADPAARPLRICLLGRPNVGKSSLANCLLGETRQIVSDIPGTTRDAVDLLLTRGGISFVLIDTAGVRRKKNITGRLEHLSVIAALRSMERADVAVVVLDGNETFADQDARLLSLVHERGRALVVVVNKMDLLDQGQKKTLREALAHELRFVPYAPVVRVSARSGQGVNQILKKAHQVYQNAGRRITTGELNQFMAKAQEQLQPAAIKGRRAKFLFITQVEVYPPTLVCSVNDPKRIAGNYEKYLENQLRKRFSFEGTPVRWLFRKRNEPHEASRRPTLHGKKPR